MRRKLIIIFIVMLLFLIIFPISVKAIEYENEPPQDTIYLENDNTIIEIFNYDDLVGFNSGIYGHFEVKNISILHENGVYITDIYFRPLFDFYIEFNCICEEPYDTDYMDLDSKSLIDYSFDLKSSVSFYDIDGNLIETIIETSKEKISYFLMGRYFMTDTSKYGYYHISNIDFDVKVKSIVYGITFELVNYSDPGSSFLFDNVGFNQIEWCFDIYYIKNEYIPAYRDGYNDGYDKGKIDGFNDATEGITGDGTWLDGYQAGQAEAIKSMDGLLGVIPITLGSIWLVVSDFLSYTVFGINVWMILILFAGFGIIILLLKILT